MALASRSGLASPLGSRRTRRMADDDLESWFRFCPHAGYFWLPIGERLHDVDMARRGFLPGSADVRKAEPTTWRHRHDTDLESVLHAIRVAPEARSSGGGVLAGLPRRRVSLHCYVLRTSPSGGTSTARARVPDRDDRGPKRWDFMVSRERRSARSVPAIVPLIAAAAFWKYQWLRYHVAVERRTWVTSDERWTTRRRSVANFRSTWRVVIAPKGTVFPLRDPAFMAQGGGYDGEM